jgi:anti-sigma factor RsiW
MSDPLNAIDDDMLHAFVDGQLDAQDAERVTQWLAERPADMARVVAWQAQRAQLRALHADVLDEPVPGALRNMLRPRAPRWPYALAASVVLAAGFGLGWWARPAWQGDLPFARAGTPPFVRDAAVAHAVYTPEKRHPVEVTAEQQEHLVQWLSKRLNAPLRAPVLTERGFNLVGGRLLPATGDAATARNGPSANALASPRAQFMYENANGERITLYVSVFSAGAMAPTAFRFAEQGRTQTFYWIDGRQGYALSGELPKPVLAELAEAVYRQLSP